MVVVLLLAVIWAAVLVPPVVQAHAARREAFLVSFGPAEIPEVPALPSPQAQRIRRRRRILGGLLIAMAGTGLAGLLPTFRVLLVVHLFLVDSFLAYVALLAHLAARRFGARAARPSPSVAPPSLSSPAPAPAVSRAGPRRRAVLGGGGLGDLPPIVPAG